jgi:outer membrane protein assembly factor BamE
MSASSSRLVVGLLFLIGTAACSYLTPYKIDIQQGNVVTPEAIDKLRVGMTKPQVGFILGTPLLADVFHGNRWDYVYYLRKGGRIREERKVRLLFEDSKLRQIDGDVVAAKAKDAKPTETVKTKDAAPSQIDGPQEAKPGEAAQAQGSSSGSAKDAAPGDAAKAKDAEPVEPAPARYEKKQP